MATMRAKAAKKQPKTARVPRPENGAEVTLAEAATYLRGPEE